MDATRFDSLTRSLGADGSRRRLIAGLLGGAVALIGGGRVDARRCTAGGTICREHANCCSGLCEASSDGRRRCSFCGICEEPQVCGEIIEGGPSHHHPAPGCCFPPGTPGVCRQEDFITTCCLSSDGTGSQGVGCFGNTGTCFNPFAGGSSVSTTETSSGVVQAFFPAQ